MFLEPFHRHAVVILWCVAVTLIGVTSAARGDEFPQFEAKVIDPAICNKACYAVTLADVNGDKRPDIVAVTERQVLWYEAPNWKKHVIIEDQTDLDNVCIAPYDIDGDGAIDFALGAGWTKIGTVQWLSRGETLNDRWNVHMIGRELWTHRMRFADVLGTGRAQLVVSPLNKSDGEQGVRLTAFKIPDKPKTEAWPRTVMDATLNRMHNHWHVTGGDGEPARTLTASQEGIHLVGINNGNWFKHQYHKGASGDSPNARGAGEIKDGKLSKQTTFITTIEPMHGTSLVVYTAGNSPDKPLERRVLDDTLRRGHALWTADVDGDGADEIICGHSDAGPGPVKGPGVYIFDAVDKAGTKWQKHVIDDGGIATEDVIAADLTGDGRIDIVAGGRASKNLKLYVNAGP